MTFKFCAALALATVMTAGCGADDEPKAGPAESTSAPAVNSNAATRMPDAAPDGQPASQQAYREPALNPDAARNIRPFDRTGIAACDNYADVVAQCINVHTVGMARRDLRVEFSHAVRDWKAQLSGGSSEAEVAQRCTDFRDSFRSKLVTAGCSGN